MKALIVLGSPRKDGNSETLARTVAEELKKLLPLEIEYLRLSKKKISPCIGCGNCEKTGMCIIKDDMQEIYEQVDTAEIIVLATPVYFYGPSSQLKAFMDRFQARWSRKYLLKERFRLDDKRAGYLLSTGATKGKKLFDASVLIAKSYFDAIDVKYNGSFVVRGADEKGALLQMPEELSQAADFAQQIAEESRLD